MVGLWLMHGPTAGRGRLASVLIGLVCLGWKHAAADEPSISIVTTRPQPMMANLGDDYRSTRLDSDRDAFEQAYAALAEHHDLNFHATPLRDAVAAVAEKAEVRIVFDQESLDDSGLDIDAVKVTDAFKDMSLRASLRELLDDAGLDLVFRNERFVVTTADAAAQRIIRFFYPLIAGTDVDEVIALVERTVAPDSWDTVGGKGAIMPMPAQMGTGLVISQTESVHEEITTLLSGLDAALWTADPVDDGVEHRYLRTYLVADPLVRESAAERLADMCNESLPHGSDPKATIEVIGESVIVRSKSRAFQVMAAQVLSSLQGVDAILIEEEGAEHDAAADPDSAPAADHATRFRRTALPPAVPARP